MGIYQDSMILFFQDVPELFKISSIQNLINTKIPRPSKNLKNDQQYQRFYENVVDVLGFT